jgi:hypothetical protein
MVIRGSTLLAVRLPPAEFARLDSFIASLPEPRPTRPEALRRLAGKALDTKGA